MKKFCPKCDTYKKDTMKSCNVCGSDLSIDEVSNAVDGVSVLIETQKPTEN